MLKKLGIIIGFLCCTLIANTAMAAASDNNSYPTQDRRQYYKSSERVQTMQSNVEGGRGALIGRMAFLQENATQRDAIKEIGYMTLKRGDFIGLHSHVETECAYIIVSGTGLFSDGKKERVVATGDVTIARIGQSHGLRNIGYEPLVFIKILAQNDRHALNNVQEQGPAANAVSKQPPATAQKPALTQQPTKTPKPTLAQPPTATQQPAPVQQPATQKPALTQQQPAAQKPALTQQQPTTASKKPTLAQPSKKDTAVKPSREEARKAREDARIQRQKDREDMLAQREIKRENERLAREKARQEAKNPKKKTTADREREAELRAARAEEAAWEAQQREKIRKENPKELNDEFAIGIK